MGDRPPPHPPLPPPPPAAIPSGWACQLKKGGGGGGGGEMSPSYSLSLLPCHPTFFFSPLLFFHTTLLHYTSKNNAHTSTHRNKEKERTNRKKRGWERGKKRVILVVQQIGQGVSRIARHVSHLHLVLIIYYLSPARPPSQDRKTTPHKARPSRWVWSKRWGHHPCPVPNLIIDAI